MSPVYCRNCGSAVKLPGSLPATRSPSPYERFDSAASTYYQPGNTLQNSYSSESLHSHRSLSPHSRSFSPNAFDLRIQNVRPAGGGHVALSVATWGDPSTALGHAPHAPHAQTFHLSNTKPTLKRSRSPEMRRRPSERNLPPLRAAPAGPAHGSHRMMSSASATELRYSPGLQGLQGLQGQSFGGKLRGAMVVQEPPPFRPGEALAR